MKIISYRTTMPFDNRSDGQGASISPESGKSTMPYNNIVTIQDILNGDNQYNTLHGGGSWSPGEDTFTSYKETGDDYKRRETDLDRWKRDEDIAQRLLGNQINPLKAEWKVKMDGGSIYFVSFELAQEYLRKNNLPFKYLSKIAQNQSSIKNAVGLVSDSLNKCFMVESIDLVRGVKETGSAFCVKKNYFLTCAHVILKYNKYEEVNEQNFMNKNISVNLFQNNQFYKSDVVAVDPQKDLALLHSDVVSDSFEIDNESLIIGQPIIVIGSPHGYDNNVTEGIISSLHRKLYYYNNAPDYMFVDANIFPGNSGGPVIGVENGKVVGMITLVVISSGNYGLNAALPSTYINDFCLKHIK